MNLPLVLDIALGLIFIYLILSLLASEIQELISTLLQWRAEHLKRSIDILLSGQSLESTTVQNFVDELYASPLIQSLNQEAKGPIATFFRHITQRIGDLYHGITGTKNVFGEQRSGPSYIPGSTFAVALIQKLDLETLSQKMSELAIRKFSEERLALLQDALNALRNSLGNNELLGNEYTNLRYNLSEILDDFVNRRTTFSASVDHAVEQLIQFIETVETTLGSDHHCKDIVRSRLPYLKQTILLGKLEPTISEVLAIALNSDSYRNMPPELAEIVARINQANPHIPEHLKQNLLSLGSNVQMKAQNLEQGILEMEEQVSSWFDHSMERASGVYKRNSKGIAIIIGFIIAIITNADTFHIVNRLSKDSILRSSITQAAEQAVAQSSQATMAIPASPEGDEATAAEPGTIQPTTPIEQDIDMVRDAVNTALDGLPLPLGWNEINMQQQVKESVGWPVPLLRRVIGWMVTGISISMGASFWYGILGKVISVRNTGKAENSK